MKKIQYLKLSLSLVLGLAGGNMAVSGNPVEILAFSLPDGSGGLKLAYRASSDKAWSSIGNHHSFLGSDFGAWGKGKKMYNVRIGQDDNGTYWIIFNPDKNGEVIAFTSSHDFEHWKPQEYRRSDSDFMSEIPSSVVFKELTDASVQNQEVRGSIMTVDSDLIDRLNGYIHFQSIKNAKNDERTDQDAWRFKDLKPLTAKVTLDRNGAKPISDKFIGVFFEDINYGADGGLYAELIQNRDFEYSNTDRK